MKIYTKKGDTGTTSLVGGQRVGKDDLRVVAYGTVDELSAFTALLRDAMGAQMEGHRADLLRILGVLMSVESSLAGVAGMAMPVAWLEGRIDALHEKLTPLTHFTLPGGHPLVSQAHVCRTVCRRAERCAVAALYQIFMANKPFNYRRYFFAGSVYIRP
jgi:cob(I)alamin adenosyltransferase